MSVSSAVLWRLCMALVLLATMVIVSAVMGEPAVGSPEAAESDPAQGSRWRAEAQDVKLVAPRQNRNKPEVVSPPLGIRQFQPTSEMLTPGNYRPPAPAPAESGR